MYMQYRDETFKVNTITNNNTILANGNTLAYGGSFHNRACPNGDKVTHFHWVVAEDVLVNLEGRSKDHVLFQPTITTHSKRHKLLLLLLSCTTSSTSQITT